MSKKFKVRYYETVLNEREEQYEEIIEKNIKAGYFYVDCGQALFFEKPNVDPTSMGNPLVAAFSRFTSVEEIDE